MNPYIYCFDSTAELIESVCGLTCSLENMMEELEFFHLRRSDLGSSTDNTGTPKWQDASRKTI